MKKILEIKLLSDLCVGVGKHFAATIDLDTATDKYGIPYIPSRRLKGCMREVAQMIGISAEKIDAIFGKSGSEKPGSLCLNDARIENYTSAVQELETAEVINPAVVTELFCSVRGETAVEKDIAKKGTLRFIRVVNKVSPIDLQPMKFVAEIEFDDSLETDITNICNGLRNIGYHRNRGLGAVSCRLIESKESFELNDFEFEDDAEYEFIYLAELQNDIMLPSNDANNTLDFVPGTAVMGALASKYNGSDFNDVFLSGKVRFGNLYISDKNGTDYIPTPRFLAKIKVPVSNSDKGVKNLIADNDKRVLGEDVPQYKVLKKGYVNSVHGYKKPKVKVVYHNAVCEGGEGLYTQHCLCSGQFFKGSVTANGSLMKKIYPLFASGTISFGRSKTAQYARCKIHPQIPVKCSADTVALSASQTAAYVCESDVVLTNEAGVFTTDISALIAGVGLPSEIKIRKETSIATRTVSGYNAKWNLKKPQFPVICAGSVIVFVAEEVAIKNAVMYIGEKTNEGFGKVRLLPDAAKFATDSFEPEDNLASASGDLLVSKIEMRKLDDRIIEKAICNCQELGFEKRTVLNSSQVGRLLLMCKQSVDYSDFESRVNSIKTDSVRDTAEKLLGKSKIELIIHEISKGTCFEEMLTDSSNRDEALVWSKQKKYILTFLTVAKYRLKEAK